MFLKVFRVKHNITIFLLVLGLLWFFSSCNSTKYVPENKNLLAKNIITVNGSKKTKENLNPYIIQRPNTKVLGLPIPLYVYGWPKKDYEKKWDNQILKYKDSAHFFTNILSLKQTVGYANFRKDLAKWFFENGESPILLDEKKSKKTIKNLKLYYIDQGFFNTQVSYQIDSISTKKVLVKYTVKTNKAYTIDSIKQQIASPVIDSLYQRHKTTSIVKEKQQFKRQNFEKEAERLTHIFRNAGIYHFSKYAINFKDIDSTKTNHKTNVLIDIADRFIEKDGKMEGIPYQISYIEQVKVYTDYSYLQRDAFLKDSTFYKDIGFYAYDRVNYKPKYLSRSIFIKPGEKYADLNNELTRKHLRELNNFKSIRINYEEVSDTTLAAHILLTPRKRYGIKLETEGTHSNQKPRGLSGKLSFKNNNTFKGNEILQLSLQGSLLNSIKFTNDKRFFNAWELGIDASFKFPRFIVPFETENLIPNRMSPKSAFSVGSSLQKNVGLDKQRFTGIIEYNWKADKKTSHAIELLNAQYINNLNIESFFDVYASELRKLEAIQLSNFPAGNLDAPLDFINLALADVDFEQNFPDSYKEVENISKRYAIITEDILVPAITYNLVYNTQTSYKDVDFSYFRMRFASSGLLTSLVTKSNTPDTPKQILGTNVAQYLKIDFEYRKHWDLQNSNILAFRSNLGLAVPYGNSSSIPFSRSYFAGGPNDIRAWRIYELGPGSENSGSEFNVGNLKLLSSLEYRFDILGSFKGAIFADAGNIWDITNSELTSSEAKFNNLQSLQNIAIGTGLGVRYDFSFLVFRADLGFKTYEPYNTSGKKWFTHYNFANSVLNIGINYPF